MKLVLIGLPGSGKGTQAEKLSEYYGIPKITTGDIYREIAKENSEFGKKIKEILDRGEIVPDEITNEIIGERIKALKGWVLDGYPRTMKQVEFLEANYPDYVAILINVKKEELVKRLSARRICPNCKAVYNLLSNPPKKDEICDKCGSKLVQRDDDKPEIVRKRIEVQEKELKRIAEFYKKKGKLITVDGNKSIEEVFKDIVARLGEKR